MRKAVNKPRGVPRARNGETVVVPTRLGDIERQIRRLSKERKARETTEAFTDVPLDWALDAAKKLPTDNEKMAAASALRRRARGKFHDGGDEDQIIAVQAVAEAIEGLCNPIHPPGTVTITPTNEEYTEAEQRYGLIRRQIDAVWPDDDEMTEAAEWILEGNLNQLRDMPNPGNADTLVLWWLEAFDAELSAPEEEEEKTPYKRNGADPWEVSCGGKATGKRDVNDDDLDHTKAGKKKRAKAMANVRRLDPTVTPIAPLKQRDQARALAGGGRRRRATGHARPGRERAEAQGRRSPDQRIRPTGAERTQMGRWLRTWFKNVRLS